MIGSPCAGGHPTRSLSPAARWLGALLTAAALLAATPDPAAAQSLSGTPVLYQSSLNGSTITLNNIYFGDGVALQKNRYAILDWPAVGAGTLSISSVSGNSAQSTVTLTLAYSGSFTTDQSIRIRLNELVTQSGGFLTISTRIPVFASDPGLAVGAVSGSVTEGGSTATFTVKLNTRPTASVTVTVTSQDTTEGRVAPASLSFSTSTWNTPQTVTVTGVDDSLTDGDRSWDVRLDPSSSDASYNGLANVDVAVTTLDDEGAPMVNSVTITSSPATGGTYALGETIEVRVGFDQSVTVTGTPQLALTIGAAARQADYAAGTGTAMLTFRYTVQTGDVDVNGIGIGAAALTLNGGRIRLMGGTGNAILGLGASAITASASHKVDSVRGPPGVAGVLISSPDFGTAFERGETIAVTVTFNKPVAVTGTPQLALTIGSAARQADYAAGTATALTFRYTVAQTDADADGISIGAGALSLNGGTIRLAGSTTVNAVLGLGFRAIANSAAHKVTGGTFNTPVITDIRITNSPLSYYRDQISPNPRLGYGLGEVVEFRVTFSRSVTVTGQPILPVDRPSSDDYWPALYFSGTGTRYLVFHITVMAGDREPNNITLQGNTLVLNGGTINDARDATQAATLTYSNAIRSVPETQSRQIVSSISPPVITLSRSTLAITEETTGAYTVRLNQAPSSNVVVTATRSSTILGLSRPLDATRAAAETLTFTPTTWNTGQTVLVYGEADADAAAGSATITHAVVDAQSADNFDAAVNQLLPVTVTDDEHAAVILSRNRLEVTESAEGAYTVRLSHVPLANVQVLLTSSDAEHARVSTTAGGPYAGEWSVKFTPTTWNTGQTVYVEGRDDADAADERETIRHTVYAHGSADEYDAVTAALPVTILDDEAMRARIISTSPSTLRRATLNTAQVQVGLANTTWAAGVQTGAAVGTYFALDTSVPGLTVDSIVSVDTSARTAWVRLAYTGDAFETAQPVAVRVLAAAHAGTEALTTGAVTVMPNPGLTVAPRTGLRTTESGGTATFTVRLATAPTATVVLGLVSSNTAEGTVAPTTLTFAPATWQTAQPVTLTGVDDADVDGTQRYMVTLMVNQQSTLDGIYDGVSPVTVTAANQDNEFGLDVSSVAGSATEGGGTAAFTVALLTQPAAAVTVAVASQNTAEGIAAPGSLVYTTTTWETGRTVTVTGRDDNADDGDVSWNVQLTSSSSDTNYHALTEDVAVTTTDNDGAPGVTLSLNPGTIDETGAGSTSTVTARLAHPSGAATTVTVTAGTAYAVGTDATILIPAGATTAAADTALITAVANATDEPDRTEMVTATVGNARAIADGTTMSMTVTGASLTVRDDDPAPAATLTLNPAAVAENGGVATVTATLDRPSSAPTTVTVTPVTGAYTVGTGAAGTIIMAAGDTANTADSAVITGVDDAIDQGTAASTYRTATVTAALANTQGTGTVTGATLTLNDDDNLPTVALALMPAAIAENGGVATITATLSGLSSQAVTLTVATTVGMGAVAADFTASGTTLMIAAGTTTSTGTVTVTAHNNNVASGSKQLTVSGTAAGGHSIADPTAETLTINDDDTPQATLVLTPATIAENGGIATVTARLDRQSTGVVTVTVAAAPVAPAVAGDFTLSTATLLTFAANATTSSGLVTVTAVNNAADAPNKRVTVSGTASDSLSLTNDPADVTLTVTDDDAAPGVTLALNPTSVAENGGVSTVTATLSHPSSEPSTVTVTGVAGSYTVGTDATITIAAGATTAASDTVLVTAMDDQIHQGSTSRTVTVTGTLANPQGAGAVTGAALTLTDDETLPTVALAVTSTAITEAGGVAQVTATLSGASSQAVTLTVATTAGTGTVAGDFTQTGTTLMIAAGNTTSAGPVTVTAVDNAVDAPNKQVTVSATAAGGHGVATPPNVTLTITDDEATPTATLVLTPPAILENGEVSTVTARLSHPTTEETRLTVATTAVSPAVAADFTRTGSTLTVAAGATTSTGTVTVTAVDNTVASGRKQVRVAASAAGGRGVGDPAVVTLLIRDDEYGLDESAVTGPVTEDGGTATFTVALQTQPSAAVTVTVTSQDSSEGTVAPSALVFTASTWETAQPVTVTGVDDNVDDGNVPWQVRLDPSSSDVNYDGLDHVAVAVTTEDNDDAPTVTLVLTPPAITENEGVSTVTATLAHPSGAATTVTVTVAPVSPATAGDVMRSTPATLLVAAGATVSTGTVTVTAEDNDVDAPDKAVTVSATLANDLGVGTVSAATLTLADDDERGIAFVPAALVVAAGSTTAYTVALTSEPTDPVTVTLTSDAAVTVAPTRLTFTAMSWDTAQPVTLTVAADTTAPANLVEHRVTGGAYETEPRALPVTRMAVPMIGTTDPIETSGKPGVHHSLRDGQLVMVTEEAGVPERVRFKPTAALTRPLTVTVRPLGEAEAAAVAGSGVRLGLPGERVALDVAVTPSRPGRLCLPVSDELWTRAAGRPLFLLHAGERVAGSTEERDATGRVLRVCADVMAFSPFAVGYEANQRVAFSESEQGQTFTFYTGREVKEDQGALPGAEGGERPLTYSPPEPALPDGLEYDEPTDKDNHGGTITGTPTAPMKQDYTLTVTDVYGEKAVLAFMIEVKPGIESRDLALVLAGIGRTWATDAVEILGSRASPPPSRLHVTLGGQVLRLTDPAESAPAAGSPGPPASSPSPLAGEGRGEGASPAAGTSPWQRVTGVAVGVARALGVTLDTPAFAPAPPGAGQGMGSTFQDAQSLLNRSPADPRRTSAAPGRSPLSIRPVSAKDLLARSAFELPLTRTDADGLPTWTLWGRGAASGFSGQPEEGFKMDGTLYSGYLGLDYRQASLLMGLAVAHSTGEVDYERTGGTPTRVDVKLTSILPYAHWQPYAGLGVWGLLGAGWGDMDLKAKGDSRTHATTLTSWLGAVGGRQALTTWQGIDLAAKTDAFLTTVRSEAKLDLPEARGHAERVRLLVEGQTAVDLSPVSRVQPRIEVGGRWDSGTAEQGLGLELGGGLAYTQTEWGLSVAMQGRYLLVHEDGAFEDWGASVHVRLDPGVGGEGAYLTVAPVWGQAGSGVEQLWGNAAAVPGSGTPARAAGWRPGQVEVNVGYGLALAAGRGLLTPYGGLALGDPGTARYRLGSRWAWRSWLVNLEGERAEQQGQDSAHGVSVRLGWQW